MVADKYHRLIKYAANSELQKSCSHSALRLTYLLWTFPNRSWLYMQYSIYGIFKVMSM